ncbi:MAG: SLC13 family permease, partial [Gemmatimonadota bacterium]|nr:SLC13 family permease [Gemmatimonadota bacterium]
MTPDIALVLGILVVAVILFVTELVRIDVVAILVLVTLPITGLLTPQQAISGFSNPAVITVWAVFILSGGLSRTGVAGILGRQVLRLAGTSERGLVMVIMLTSASLSAFMNNVGVAALLLPVVMDISRRTRRPPSKLLVPLAYSSLLGGLLTLIGTPPNILVSAGLEDAGLRGFAMFDFAPVGAGVVLAGIAYMTFVGVRLLPSRDPGRVMAGGEEDLEEAYGIRERLFALDVPADSPLIGKTLSDSRLGEALDLSVLALQRGSDRELAPDRQTRLREGDRIIVQGPRESAREIGARAFLSLDSEPAPLEELVSEDVGFAEVRVKETSKLVGRTLREIGFRHRFEGCLVLSVWRDGEPLRTHLATTELEGGDILLVHGARDALAGIEESPDFEVS